MVSSVRTAVNDVGGGKENADEKNKKRPEWIFSVLTHCQVVATRRPCGVRGEEGAEGREREREREREGDAS